MTSSISSVSIPEGSSGIFRVEHFVVTEEDAKLSRLRAAINPHRDECPVDPGSYTALRRSGKLIMSDTISERWNHEDFVRRAEGDVLIAGLGIGMVAAAVLRKDSVRHVTIVEKEVDVIKLVAGHLPRQDKLEMLCADVLTWKPQRNRRWDHAWFDIWDGVCEDNLQDITRLKRRFCKRAAAMGFWSLRQIRRLQARYRP